jgi:hypothetical protein
MQPGNFSHLKIAHLNLCELCEESTWNAVHSIGDTNITAFLASVNQAERICWSFVWLPDLVGAIVCHDGKRQRWSVPGGWYVYLKCLKLHILTRICIQLRQATTQNSSVNLVCSFLPQPESWIIAAGHRPQLSPRRFIITHLRRASSLITRATHHHYYRSASSDISHARRPGASHSVLASNKNHTHQRNRNISRNIARNTTFEDLPT